MQFYKYHGTGNDFIIIDNWFENIFLSESQIQKLCDRNFGIGSDGLLILKCHKLYDFEMQFFNPDGSEATFCGNGARCIAAFARYLDIISDKTVFMAKDGLHEVYFIDNEVVVKMKNVDLIKNFDDYFYVNTGTHHVVKFVENVDLVDIMNQSPEIRYHKNFEPYGTNVNYVQICDNYLKIRTYEKGVEKETLACGTGVVASALVYAHAYNFAKNDILVKAKGGDLNVKFLKENNIFTNIYLQGNAVLVFKGEIFL